jgi:hypothetical protein
MFSYEINVAKYTDRKLFGTDKRAALKGDLRKACYDTAKKRAAHSSQARRLFH